ncbi:hypothetical protein DNTS_030356 [Danionella cerebrum]|uniref:Major facilitator superfamily (MFS) profile domain-containing protein n=1 Tax=Danionella cerebrum TaxID=2873325 RepID=A0A553QIX2_9TELE|nr:hypothetical protein DNTS_030356 [Danionella translucida]
MADTNGENHDNPRDGKTTSVAENYNSKPILPGIPRSRKLCYAIGGMPYEFTLVVKLFYMQIFLLDVVKMEAFYASIILFLGKVWDAITDPLIGYAVSKSGRTRIGKFIPWIMLSMPFAIISYVMLWFAPHDSTSTALSFSWYFIWCCLFDSFVTCHHVPYSSLNMFLGGNQKDRDSATAYMGVHHAKRSYTCNSQNDTVEPSGNITEVDFSDLQNTRRAYLISALVLGAMYFLCCLILFLGVKEQLTPQSEVNHPSVPYLTTVKMVMTHNPYVRLLLGFLFSSLAFQVTLGNFALFSTYAADMGAYFQHFNFVNLLKNPSYPELEPLFYSYFVFFNKLGGGLSLGISTLVLHFVGYTPGVCKHTERVVFTIWVLFAILPICLVLVGMTMFYFYPINEKRRQEIQEAMRTKTTTEDEKKL